MTQTEATQKATYEIDPTHTTVEFAVKHMMFATVKGSFSGATGHIRMNGDLTEAEIAGEVDVATVNTGVADRDGHLKSPEFFDAENHPKLSFQSKRIEPVGDDRYRVVGDLTIRGVTREVPFDVTFEGRGIDPWGGERIGATAGAQVDREEFGLKWNQVLEAGGVLVGGKVRITLHIQAVKKE